MNQHEEEGTIMERGAMLSRVRDANAVWDFVIIGGGATGIGTAIEAASRGYDALLVEQGDFGCGTSSRSTKLVHGGIRYLQQGNLSLVLEALKERGILIRNAPHLVHNLPFVVPSYDWWQGPFYGMGLKLYDILAGKHGFGASKILSREKTLLHIPTIEKEGLRGGIIYYDGQFDDARLLINLSETAAEQGAALVNYMRVKDLIKSRGMVCGVLAHDAETGSEYEIKARVVVNATGVFADSIRHMDDSEAGPMMRPSQGAHIVLERAFLPGHSAIMVPHTDDGRVLFAIPWHGCVIVGTTETPVTDMSLDPKPFPAEIEFLLTHASRYLTKDPAREDVLSAFAGLRPLVNYGKEENTAAISRDHTLHISRSGLLTIAGGKWTTYRKMAEETIDQAAVLGQLKSRPSVTRNLPIHGYHRNPEKFGSLAFYGSDAPALRDLINANPRYGKKLHPKMRPLAGEAIWAARYEMARTIEDFLARRTRSLLLNAKASMEMAPKVADLMAEELGRDHPWKKEQLAAFKNLARGYLPE